MLLSIATILHTGEPRGAAASEGLAAAGVSSCSTCGKELSTASASAHRGTAVGRAEQATTTGNCPSSARGCEASRPRASDQADSPSRAELPPGYLESLPPELPIIEQDSIPEHYVRVTAPRTALVVAGTLVFACGYVVGAALGAWHVASQNVPGRSDAVDEWWLAMLVPAAGPFVTAGIVDDASMTAPFVLLGVLQTGGLAMLFGGLAAPEDKLVREDLVEVTLHVVPHVLGHGAAAQVFGRF